MTKKLKTGEGPGEKVQKGLEGGGSVGKPGQPVG